MNNRLLYKHYKVPSNSTGTLKKYLTPEIHRGNLLLRLQISGTITGIFPVISMVHYLYFRGQKHTVVRPAL